MSRSPAPALSGLLAPTPGDSGVLTPSPPLCSDAPAPSFPGLRRQAQAGRGNRLCRPRRRYGSGFLFTSRPAPGTQSPPLPWGAQARRPRGSGGPDARGFPGSSPSASGGPQPLPPIHTHAHLFLPASPRQVQKPTPACRTQVSRWSQPSRRCRGPQPPYPRPQGLKPSRSSSPPAAFGFRAPGVRQPAPLPHPSFRADTARPILPESRSPCRRRPAWALTRRCRPDSD
ncbi:putative uncharacterized protein FLJ46214 [Trichechus manatus latirostris]|uniref:Uncharacterized protein n=1 Tax=Trichechus manatus latirostris TaxID=127582 RepID=A0A2Y9FVL4_TRIMA|nr:putative uncharacterized protein FLJ46214 [Trichechus manatus latirostris]